MANTILFANSSDYCSSGCQDPNKQIIPKTNASTHSCPSRADCSPPAVCVCVCMSLCVYVFEVSARIYLWVVQERSLMPRMQYRALFHRHPY